MSGFILIWLALELLLEIYLNSRLHLFQNIDVCAQHAPHYEQLWVGVLVIFLLNKPTDAEISLDASWRGVDVDENCRQPGELWHFSRVCRPKDLRAFDVLESFEIILWQNRRKLAYFLADLVHELVPLGVSAVHCSFVSFVTSDEKATVPCCTGWVCLVNNWRLWDVVWVEFLFRLFPLCLWCFSDTRVKQQSASDFWQRLKCFSIETNTPVFARPKLDNRDSE